MQSSRDDFTVDETFRSMKMSSFTRPKCKLIIFTHVWWDYFFCRKDEKCRWTLMPEETFRCKHYYHFVADYERGKHFVESRLLHWLLTIITPISIEHYRPAAIDIDIFIFRRCDDAIYFVTLMMWADIFIICSQCSHYVKTLRKIYRWWVIFCFRCRWHDIIDLFSRRWKYFIITFQSHYYFKDISL